MQETSATLLERVKDQRDSAAWSEFTKLYQPMLLRWVRLNGVPPADVDDVTQEALTAVARRMPSFQYERGKGGGFRGYLRQVVRSKVADFWEARQRRGPHVEIPEGADPAVADASQQAWDREYDRHVLEACLAKARDKVSPENWQMFLLYFRENKTAKEVAEIVKVPAGVVAGRAWRVLELLRDLTRGLDPDAWPGTQA